MTIQAINLVSFQGRNHKQTAKQTKPKAQADRAPIESDGSKNMRNLMLGIMAIGAAAGATTSCEPYKDADTSAAAAAAAVAIGGGQHRDTVTIIKRDTINHTDTIINTVIKPIYVKDYPYHLGDSLIAEGENIGIPLDGPRPDGSHNVVYIGSKAHNRYDHKYYESSVDSIGTNKYELAVVTKVVDRYGDKPKTYYTKAIVTDVPGKGIQIMRYVADTDKRPGKNDQYKWKYAGYEIRTNGSNGEFNTRSIFDNNDNLIYKGKYEKGDEPGTFLYGAIITDPETGEPLYDENGELEFAQYDFDQAVIYTDFARSVEDPNPEYYRNYARPVEDYEHPGWAYDWSY